mmetsp:Transcript_22630/g.49415  ORF Transcript_22630/g.49415 Transcript_22630/m.49415 type:complete len:1318 (-) Transcript_22630:180-4133(-)
MAFLVPALLALLCDVSVVYLRRLGQLDGRSGNGNSGSSADDIDGNNSTDKAGEQSQVYFWIGYLAPLAIIRIVLLLLPLFLHSKTGTALRFPRLYQFLYISTLILLVAHMLALLLLNPASLESILPYDDVHHRHLLQHLHALRRIWWMLVFSTLSNTCHLILVEHVKSTAPNSDILGGKQPHSIYFAIRSRNEKQKRNRQRQRPVKHHDSDEELENDDNPEDLTLQEWEDDEEGLEEPALVQAVNEFLVDMQGRLRRTKIEWGKRLDDFSKRLNDGASSRNLNNNTNGGGQGSPVLTRGKKAIGGAGGNGGNSGGVVVSPFKVLLQLFADQENSIFKLSAAFDLDRGQTMTFFVPQLLSFLLHGATTSSEELEEWVLARCAEDIQFSHRCYFFLRAWCLEVPGETSAAAAAILSRQNSEAALDQLQQSDPQIYLDQPAPGTFQQSTSKGARGGNLCLPPSSDHKNGSNPNALVTLTDDKFLPQERAMIERLMLRVKECGELAARVLEFGSLMANQVPTGEQPQGRTADISPLDHVMSPSTMMQVVEMGAVPLDPITCRPSKKHLDCLAAEPKYGFLPMSQVGDPTQLAPPDSTEHFDKTPQFLDSLIFIAETLFHVPPESRKEELKNMLRQLECELLPDNAVYVPSRRQPQGILGRVWRVASNEAVAISTKERVPCIIPLEVILLDQDGNTPSTNSPVLSTRPTLDDLRSQYKSQGSEWSILDHLPKSFLSSSSIVPPPEPKSSHVPSLSPDDALAIPGSLSRVREETWSDITGEVALSPVTENDNDGPLFPQKRASFASSAHKELSEADIINEWRTRPRNPYRLVPLINKVAESIKDMKTSVQRSLDHLRDRAVNEELKSLTANIDGQPTDSPSSVTKLISEDEDDDVTNANNDVEMNHDNGTSPCGTPSKSMQSSSPSLPPLSPGGAPPPGPLPMGQWSSPSPSSSRKVVSATLRRRSDAQVPGGKSSSGNVDESSLTLPYGSGGDKKYKGKNRHGIDSLPPSSADSSKRGHRRTNSSGAQKPAVVFKESWQVKQERVRQSSAYGSHPGWRLFPILIKANDDLRQEELASQLIYRMASILAREKVPVWLCPYDIIALTDKAGLIEAIPDTISIDSLKKNDAEFTNLNDFFKNHYGEGTPELSDAKANFVESLAAYSMVCFLLQIKDRHNGNILIDSNGHVIHIDFGFFFLSSPGKNAGFESAPFKLTRDFVEVLDGPHSHLFHIFRELCVRSFLALRKHCLEIILLVEMLKNGNEQLKCFRGRPNDAIEGLRERFRLDLNDRACREYVNSLVDDSIENWRTDWYDRYQRYFVGVL